MVHTRLHIGMHAFPAAVGSGCHGGSGCCRTASLRPHLLLAVPMLRRVQSRRSSAGADKWLDVQVFDSAQVSHAGLLQEVCWPCADIAA